MVGPDPAVAALRTAVAADLADLPAGALVLVACSGGADSLALAAATGFVAPRRGLRAGAVVVDHGLLEGSAEVARAAAGLCRDLGLDPVQVVRVEVVRPGHGGLEQAARVARYDALGRAAAELGAAAVLLGHTLDDQAETVLLGLARGSGARSLAGMPGRRGALRRPLLGLTRHQTERACAAQQLTPWADPTNGPGPDAPLRSQVRHAVLPVLEDVLGPGVARALGRTADQLREDADHLDDLARQLLGEVRLPGGGIELDAAVLAAAPTAVRRRALRLAALEAGVPAGSLHRVHVLAMDALLTDWRGQGPVALPGSGTVRRGCGRLAVGGPGSPPGSPAR